LNTYSPLLARENDMTLALVQALLGVPSPNFRAVTIETRPTEILIRVYLESESTIDREEVDDLLTEFEALHTEPINTEIEVIVSSRSWPTGVNSLAGRPVYARRDM
jgi:hypothetical protein